MKKITPGDLRNAFVEVMKAERNSFARQRASLAKARRTSWRLANVRHRTELLATQGDTACSESSN